MPIIAGSKLGFKYPSELNVEETREPFLEKQFKKYQKQAPPKQFKQNVDADDNGGEQVQASLNGLLLSGILPKEAIIKKSVTHIQFNSNLKDIIKSKNKNLERLPTLLF